MTHIRTLKRLACIDAGSNTFSLSIYDYELDAELALAQPLHLIHSRRIPVSLSRNAGYQEIGQHAYKQALLACDIFAQDFIVFDPDAVLAKGTAVLRHASNAQALLADIRKQNQIDIEVISGEEEALLIFQALKRTITLAPEEKALFVDIGGASIECVLVEGQDCKALRSFPIGIGYLAEQVQASNPVRGQDLRAYRRLLQGALGDFAQSIQDFAPTKIIGASGSFDNIYRYWNGGKPFSGLLASFPQKDFRAMYRRLRLMTAEEQGEALEVLPERLYLMMPLLATMDYLLELSSAQELFCSGYSLREGMAYNYIAEAK